MPYVPLAQHIATKGLVSGEALSLSLSGVVILQIEEIIPPVKPGGGAGDPNAILPEKKKKKYIRVRFQYNSNIYEDIKEIDNDIEVSISNIDIIMGDEGKPVVILKNLNRNE